MLLIIISIVVSYLIGSIPTAYIFGRVLKRIDIRKHGSGNVGATNAFRVLGKHVGITVLVIDMLKGFIPVVFIGDYILMQGINIPEDLLRIILGMSCICGHNWTIFLSFKGGKGIASTFGVLFGLAFKLAALRIILALVISTWLLVFFLFRIVSVASVVSGLALPIFMALFKISRTLIISSVIIAIFIVLRHRSNIRRVLQGKEPPISFKKS